jgi:hypothetical protein
MDDRQLIRSILRALGRRLRLVRAVAAGTRLLAVGLALALVPLLLKGLFPGLAALAAAGLALGFGVAGVLYGLLTRLPLARVARLVDGRLALQERLTSAQEHLTPEAGPPGPTGDMVRAQLAETAARVRDLRPATAFPLTIPSQGRWLAPVAALAVTLALLPPIPLKLPAIGTETEMQEAAPEAEEPREKPVEQKLTPPGLPTEVFKKSEARDVQRGPLAAHDQPGDINATFRDTPMSQQRPDFRSFIKQADERLKMMARPEGLPDLSRDVTQSPYQMMIRRMQDQLQAGKLQGLSWDQIQQLLSQMGQSGQRSGGSALPDDLMQELQGQAGSPDKMLEALSRALNRVRDRDEAAQGKGGKGLREAPSRQAGGGQGQEGQGKDGQGKEGQDPGAGGSLPGTEPSLQTRGEPTPRVAGQKQDSMLEGDLREGRMEAYDTNLTGQGAETPSRLPYMEVFSQYQKMMEEALAKEPIPFSYREQVKEYFRTLENR